MLGEINIARTDAKISGLGSFGTQDLDEKNKSLAQLYKYEDIINK